MVYKYLSLIERISARLQGKGWGATSLTKEVNSIAKFIKKPKLAIDIGGNVGDYTAELKKKFENLEIHLFEPSSTNYEKLVKRYGGDNKVFINKKAVANNNGTAELFSNVPGSELASLTKRRLDHFDLGFDVTEEIETVKFEDYWNSQLSSKTIDIVKIDVEGHELDVLNGMGTAISQIKVIQFEFGGCNIDTKTYFQDYWYFFNERFFDIYRITPIGLQPIKKYLELDEFFATTNFLCINKRL